MLDKIGGTMASEFFEKRTEPSEVKAIIVQKYFDAWSRIILPTARKYYGGKIAYVDLYAGPGRYRDGSASTPLLVLQKAIENSDVANALVALLNDQDSNSTATLRDEISKLRGIDRLKYAPFVLENEVAEDADRLFSQAKRMPRFTFLDPFGYKGISQKLVNRVIRDWGCDCVFFFNYNRINAGVSNPAVRTHMDSLFGEGRAEVLRGRVNGAKPHLREEMVLEAMAEALQDMGGEFILPFRFRSAEGRLTHHLIFVSKDFKGYEVMKGIMASASSASNQGVSTFTYSPADETMPLLFELSRPLDDLETMLKTEFSGQTMSMASLYRAHSVGRPYLSSHYKQVLAKLEEDGHVTVHDPEGKKRKKGTFADRLEVTFPRVLS